LHCTSHRPVSGPGSATDLGACLLVAGGARPGGVTDVGPLTLEGGRYRLDVQAGGIVREHRDGPGGIRGELLGAGRGGRGSGLGGGGGGAVRGRSHACIPFMSQVTRLLTSCSEVIGAGPSPAACFSC